MSMDLDLGGEPLLEGWSSIALPGQRPVRHACQTGFRDARASVRFVRGETLRLCRGFFWVLEWVDFLFSSPTVAFRSHSFSQVGLFSEDP